LLRRLDPLLDEIQTLRGEAPPAAPDGPTRRDSAAAHAEYRDLRFHDAGALGEVYRAQNAELNREVALKFLKPSRAGDPESRRRFLQEAEVTGRLEHPGVVPIYALGSDATGAPCYAMRFIRGATLQDALAGFHAAETPTRDRTERSLALRELLTRFVSVCNTVAYAHSRGILHRDLKPRNILLGRYAETLVVDWGLAKPFAREPASGSGEEEPLTPSAGSGSDTPTVGVVGTLPYMSPEQAEPRWELVGPASDIFGLGAVLYAILTGQAPYSGATPGTLLEQVKQCAFPAPRQVQPGVPRALEAICLKAMAPEPARRYASALELAADVQRWLADEPVTAAAEPLSVRARRWVRRHPRLVSGTAAAALVGFTALVLLVLVVTSSNRIIRQKNVEILGQNQQLAQSNRALAAARTEAEQQRDQAQEVTAFLISSFRKPDPAQDGRTVTVAEVLSRAVTEREARPKMAAATRATIFLAVGQTFRGLGLIAETVAVVEKALAIRRQELGNDHPDTLAAMNELAGGCEAAAQFNRAISLYQEVLQARRTHLGAEHLETLRAMNDLAHPYLETGQLDRARPLLEQVLRVRRVKLGDDDPETLVSMNNLAVVYLSAGQSNRAILLHEQALQAARARLGDDHPSTLIHLNNLAYTYGAAGQFDRSFPLLEQVLRARRARLGDDHPETLVALNNLAVARARAGQLDIAITLHEQALRQGRTKLGEDHPLILLVRESLGAALRDAGRLDRALPLLEQTLAAPQTKQGRGHPDTLRNQSKLGHCLILKGKHAEAVPLLRACVQLQEKIQPNDWSTAQTRSLLGEALTGQKSFDEAEPLLSAGWNGLRERRATIPPSVPGDARIREAGERLVRLYETWGKPAAAEAWRKKLPPPPPAASQDAARDAQAPADLPRRP
jgi:serine/threonine protein kinase/Tfp pilus assembly protein PilF